MHHFAVLLVYDKTPPGGLQTRVAQAYASLVICVAKGVIVWRDVGVRESRFLAGGMEANEDEKRGIEKNSPVSPE